MDGAQPDGFLTTLRRIGATLTALFANRIELFAADVEEGVSSAMAILLWGFAAIWLISLALLAFAATLVLAFWEHRLLAAGCVTIAFSAAGLGTVLAFRRRMRERPRFLGGTIAELDADAGAISGRHRDA